MSNQGQKTDKFCNRCNIELNTWDVRLSRTLAYKYPCCEKCIAEEYGTTVDALRNCFEHYYGIRPCLGI